MRLNFALFVRFMFFWLAFVLLGGIRHFFAAGSCSIDRLLIAMTVIVSSVISIVYIRLHTLVLLSITSHYLLLFLITYINIHISIHYYIVVSFLLIRAPIILFYV